MFKSKTSISIPGPLCICMTFFPTSMTIPIFYEKVQAKEQIIIVLIHY
jgi:hypothetical protein